MKDVNSGMRKHPRVPNGWNLKIGAPWKRSCPFWELSCSGSMLVFGGVWFGFCVDYFASCLTPALRLALKGLYTLSRSVEIRTADGVKHAANVPASCNDLVCFEDVRSIDSLSHKDIQAKWWANSEIASYLPNQVQVRNISTWWKGSLLTAVLSWFNNFNMKEQICSLGKNHSKPPFLSKDRSHLPWFFHLLASPWILEGTKDRWFRAEITQKKGTIPALK